MVTGLRWDTAGLEGNVALRVAFTAANGTCTFDLRATGAYRSGSPVYLWAAPDVADPAASVLQQDGVDASAQGTSNHDLPQGPGASWSGGMAGEIDLAEAPAWLFVAFALGPQGQGTHVTLDVACDGPIPMPVVSAGRSEVASLTSAGAESGVGAGAGPVGVAQSETLSLQAASPEVLVRLVRPDQAQLAEQGTLVVEHPGGEEVIPLPAPDPVVLVDGGPGEYVLRLDHLQVGSYLGVVLIAGLAPLADADAAALGLVFTGMDA